MILNYSLNWRIKKWQIKNFVAQSMVKLAEVELANDTLNIIKNFGNHPHTTEQQYNNFCCDIGYIKKSG